MKRSLKILTVSVCISIVLACQKNEIALIDETKEAEKAPTYTPDSPMWKKLASPSSAQYTEGVSRTEQENLYTCVMVRRDTMHDHLKVDNFTSINMTGSIDKQTIISGTYNPDGNYWITRKSNAIARFSPLLLGPFAITTAGGIIYFSLLGSGYALGDSYPSGISFFKDFWLQTDFNQTGDIVGSAVLTGFMANNAGYFLENNENKQVWFINNGQIYEKKKPFPNRFLGRFVTTSAQIKGKDSGFMISESENNKIKTQEFYQYNADTDTWLRKADFPGDDRYEGVIFGINDKVYYGLGQSKTEAKGFRDIWQYDIQTDKWTNFATYPGSGNVKVATAKVSGKVYIGLGYYVGTTQIKTEKYIGVTDFWEFVPN